MSSQEPANPSGGHRFLLKTRKGDLNRLKRKSRRGISPEASTGTSPLLMFQGSAAPLTSGDYVSNPLGLNTFYRFFIEVPPGLSHLVVQLFDPDVGRGGSAEAAAQRDRDRNGFNSSVTYTLIRPDGSQAATLNCDNATCLDNNWQSLLDSTTAQNTAAGHWELRVDMSSAVTAGDDINALGIRANDGTSGSGGTELNIYAESPYPIGVNPPVTGTNSQTYTAYPYITSGCSCSENDFDYDSDEGNVGSILLMSPTMAFSQTITSSQLSTNSSWKRNNISGWTTDSQSGDYGIWTSSMGITSYVSAGTPNGNLSDIYFSNYQAAANPPTSNSPANSFRIYLPTDLGTAPVKPYVEQSLTRISGPDPALVGQTTVAAVTINVVNPTAQAITFSATNLVSANVPGAGVVYHGNANVTQGVLISQPAVGGTGNITWNPGTLAAGATARLTYQVSVTPTFAGQRLPVTGTPASGNGTRAQYVDETGNTTQSRATFLFGPLCELAVTQGFLLPCGTIKPTLSGASGPFCPGDSMTITVTLSGGTGPYTVTLNTGDTQTGSSPLTFNVSPTTTTGYQVASGHDSAGCPISSFNTLTVNVRPQIVFTPTDVNPSCPGTSTGSITVNVSAGTGPFQYSDDGGSSFQSSNVFSNLAAGTYQLVVKDGSGCTNTASTTLADPNPITFTTDATNPLCFGASTGTITINASGGTGTLQYSINGGMSFQLSNSFSNLTFGTYQLVVKDSNGCTKSGSVALMNPPLISVATVNVNPTCSAGTDGSITVNASGGTGMLMFSDDGGNSFQSSNVFSNLGAATYSIVVSDSNGCTRIMNETLTPPPAVTFTTENVNPKCTGSATGSITVNATGGTGTLTYSDDNGVSFQPSNVFSSLAAGQYNIVVKDANGCTSAPSAVTLSDPPRIIVRPENIPAATVGTAYPDTAFSETNGADPVTFTETGTLPTGMTFSNGVLSGTPTQTGAFPFTITGTDSNGCVAVGNYVLTVACSSGAITVSPSSIPTGALNSPYSGATFSPGGGTGPYTLIEAGTLPAGMTFSDGALSGTPTETGAFPITISATDSNGCSGETNYILTITCAGTTISFTPATLNAGTLGTAYTRVTITPSGGMGLYTTFFAGTLPNGMTFSGNTLSGTPAQLGTFNFTIGAIDSNGCSGSIDYALTINCETISVSPASLPSSPAGSVFPSTTFTQTGGTGTVTFSESGALPVGLMFNAETGTLSGTPLQTGSFPITVTATDSNGCTGSQNYTVLTTCQTISVGPGTVAHGTVGAPYTPANFTETGGIGSTTFSETGALPTGLMLSSAGVLSGTPTKNGNFPIVVTATDSNGCTGLVNVTVTIDCQTITVGPSSIPFGTAGISYTSTTFTQTGGIGAVTFSETGAIPNGMSFAGGVLSGTPLQTGSFDITVTATDFNGCTGSHSYTLQINCPTIVVSPSSIPGGTAGVGYSGVTFGQTGGVGTITYSESGALPTGLTFSNGMLTGTALQTGTFNISVTATDANGCTGMQNYSLVISCPVITINQMSIPSGTAGVPYSATSFTQTGGVGTIMFGETGSLPTGMTFVAGVLSGTPLQTGTFNITVTATDQNGCGGSRGYSLVINCPAITVSPGSLAAGTAGSAYTPVNFSQTGGVGTVSFAESGTLPNGMTFSGEILSGTPTQTGTFNITVTATDQNGCTGSQNYTLNINCQTITLGPDAIPNGVTSTAYNPVLFSQTGGIGTITFSESGTLPAGLTLASGVLSGTPTQTGVFPITVTATDQNGCIGSHQYLIAIACAGNNIAISPGVLPAGTDNQAYPLTTFTATGGAGGYSFTEVGNLPSGMTFSNGVLSGTPSVSGVFPITIAVGDSAGCATSVNYLLVIACQATAITVSPGSLSGGTAGSAYTPVNFSAGGGSGPYTLAFAGALPAGMSYSGGVLSGTPTQTGTFEFTVAATDSTGCSGSTNYSLSIACPTITLSPSSIPAGTAGAVYAGAMFSQTGGVGQISFTKSGTLPMGITFANGTLSGTPLQTGTFNISITATDQNGCTGTKNYSLVVNCPTITVGPVSLPQGTAGVLFTQTQFSHNGSVGTVMFTETGALPSGMTFTSGGLLSGTPLQTGSFPITVTATDANGCSGSTNYTLVINCPSITVSPATVGAAVEFVAYSPVQFTQSGGVGSVTFSTTSALPSGMALSPSGMLSGTPTQAGTFSITVMATDSNGCTGLRTVSLLVTTLDKCLKDNSGNLYVQFNSTTGNYLFTVCGPNGFTLAGSGTVQVVNSIINITENRADRRVLIQYNKGSQTGRATLTKVSGPGVSQTYTINDTNPHAICACGG